MNAGGLRMTLKELKISKLDELFSLELTIPSYQRPYRWSKKSTNMLFQDTYQAFQDGLEEYRIGSVILHKENENYNIVDGQQRLTTLSILLYCLGDKNSKLLKQTYNPLSNQAIVINYEILSNRIRELSKDELEKYKDYLLHHCTVVQIVTDNEQEAFQFFDSQNSRGKPLKPHDLLKSYHLREMNQVDETRKAQIINQWENIKEDDLDELFKNYLYPLTHWYKGKSGLKYASNKIDIFKGIKSNNVYNYAIYHKASHLFVEQFNSNGSNELIGSNKLNEFQLNQPVLAGTRFFHYTYHYQDLLHQIQKINKQQDIQLPKKRTGDVYIKQLYECVLMFFADRFGMESLTEMAIKTFYTWCYSLRLVMEAVYLETIDNYARKGHDRVNNGLNMFQEIAEMNGPEEIKLIVLEKPTVIEKNKEKYKDIYNKLWEWNGWK